MCTAFPAAKRVDHRLRLGHTASPLLLFPTRPSFYSALHTHTSSVNSLFITKSPVHVFPFPFRYSVRPQSQQRTEPAPHSRVLSQEPQIPYLLSETQWPECMYTAPIPPLHARADPACSTQSRLHIASVGAHASRLYSTSQA